MNTSNKVNDLSLKNANQVGHLFPFHATCLKSGDTLRADSGEKHRHHAGDDFAIGVSKID